ncbi:MAG: rRNA pseudouridine synthase [Spirochaetaceae bacterium]|nr:MAG: rRNA pseudouridine synthase [Spirochaetaceae bacterium]
MRLQVFLAKAGIASRRKCEEYISQGMVSVNGTVVTLPGCKVADTDLVLFNNKEIKPESELVYIALNKPVQYVCSSQDEQGRPLALDLLQKDFKVRLFNVGRLDFMSQGLIFFTNDGEFTRRVTHPSFEIEKEYNIETFEQIPEELEKEYSDGLQIEGEYYRLKRYEKLSLFIVNLVIAQGKNREIRRVFTHFNLTIRKLCRTRIGPVSLGALMPGKYRHLTKEEVTWFLSSEQKSRDRS